MMFVTTEAVLVILFLSFLPRQASTFLLRKHSSRSSSKTCRYLAGTPKLQQDFKDSDELPILEVSCADGAFPPDELFQVWGKQPLILRQAFCDSESQDSWPSWHGILDLASEDEVGMDSARMITHIPDKLESFDVQIGPIQDCDIDRMSKNGRKWTVLVNDVEHYIPSLNDWMNRKFGFLPRWRRDDAQVSVACQGGGIGPHVDNYDVFLVQGKGERLWRVGKHKLSHIEEAHSLVPDLSVRILNGVFATEDLVLVPGDVLYLPPRTIHWGIANTDNCMTVSVGCRAPSASEIISRIAEKMTESLSEEVNGRFTEESLKPPTFPTISTDVKEKMKHLVKDALDSFFDDDETWDSIVGSSMTEPKRYIEEFLVRYDEAGDEYISEWGSSAGVVLDNVLGGKGGLFVKEGVSIATSEVKTSDGTIESRLHAFGVSHKVSCSLDSKNKAILTKIERGEMLDSGSMEAMVPEIRHIIVDMIDKGILYAYEKI